MSELMMWHHMQGQASAMHCNVEYAIILSPHPHPTHTSHMLAPVSLCLLRNRSDSDIKRPILLGSPAVL